MLILYTDRVLSTISISIFNRICDSILVGCHYICVNLVSWLQYTD